MWKEKIGKLVLIKIREKLIYESYGQENDKPQKIFSNHTSDEGHVGSI